MIPKVCGTYTWRVEVYSEWKESHHVPYRICYIGDIRMGAVQDSLMVKSLNAKGTWLPFLGRDEHYLTFLWHEYDVQYIRLYLNATLNITRLGKCILYLEILK